MNAFTREKDTFFRLEKKLIQPAMYCNQEFLRGHTKLVSKQNCYSHDKSDCAAASGPHPVVVPCMEMGALTM